MTLTQHQEEKLHECLKGSAGVGKTTLMNTLLEHLPGTKLCSAPTHKALSVLQSKTDGMTVDFKTIHSALHYRPFTDPNTGEKLFIPQPNPNNPPLKGVKYLVIDEASMIGVEMLGFIEQYASLQNTTIIFVGDDKQLNPVNEANSPVFLGTPTFFDTHKKAEEFINNRGEVEFEFIMSTFKNSKNETKVVVHQPYPEVELTEIIRQGADNPIIYLSRNLGKIFDFEARHTDHTSGYFFTQNREKILDRLAESNGADDFKYLAWTNEDVEKINKEVRQRIYGNPNKIEIGETLVFNSPYKDYYANQEIKVCGLVVVDHPFSVVYQSNPDTVYTTEELKVYIINPVVVGEYNGVKEYSGVFVIHEDSEKDFASIKRTVVKNCANKTLAYNYRDNFLDKFAYLNYNHGLTIHKSQGSTYKTAAINFKNIFFNKNEPERTRLLYTAITRPSELLIIYNI
jgi:exodeoxyribonuclease-5